MKAALIATLIALCVPAALGQASEMKGMDMSASKPANTPSHNATGVVRKVDAGTGTVTLAHEPVKSLGWPGMTMPFQVRDAKLLDKLAVGKKVEFEFVQQGKDYVITRVR